MPGLDVVRGAGKGGNRQSGVSATSALIDGVGAVVECVGTFAGDRVGVEVGIAGGEGESRVEDPDGVVGVADQLMLLVVMSSLMVLVLVLTAMV